jgi:hypothetical protein
VIDPLAGVKIIRIILAILTDFGEENGEFLENQCIIINFLQKLVVFSVKCANYSPIFSADFEKKRI